LIVSAVFLVAGAFLPSATGDDSVRAGERSVGSVGVACASEVVSVSAEREILSSLLWAAESRARTKIPSSSLWEDYSQAKQDLRNEHVRAAKKAFTGIIESATEFAPAYYYLGLIAARERRFDEVRQYCIRALAIDPEFTLVRANLGNLYYRNCRFPEAAAEYERVLVTAPGFAEVHRRLAEAYSEDRSRFRDAASHFRRYLELTKDPVDGAEVKERIIELELSGTRTGE
jgi:tetratricopeptide (TPR) repeat protein